MRLLGLQGLILGAVLLVIVTQVVRDYTVHYRHTITRDLTDEIIEYSHEASIRSPQQTLAAFTRSYLASRPASSGHVILVRLKGQSILGSTEDLPQARRLARLPAVARALSGPAGPRTLTTVTIGGASFLVMTSPVEQGRQVIGTFIAAANLGSLQQAHARILLLSSIEAGLALLVALLSTFLVLRHLLGTVGAVTDAAAEISRGDLERRINYPGPRDEVGRLAATFDEMIARISGTLAGQRQLLTDVSHQLRTPLTVARGHLEVLVRGGLADREEATDTVLLVVDELHHVGLLVDRLLLLGRSLESDFIEREPVDVRAFMAETFDAAQVLADRRWLLAEIPDLVVDADAGKLRGALLNILDNAVKATRPGDTINLAACWSRDLELSVTDTGRGIPPAEQEVVFERFRRGRQGGERGGSGLGLAIVKAVAEAHGGTVRLTSAPGQGTTVTIVLPQSSIRLSSAEP